MTTKTTPSSWILFSSTEEKMKTTRWCAKLSAQSQQYNFLSWTTTWKNVKLIINFGNSSMTQTKPWMKTGPPNSARSAMNFIPCSTVLNSPTCLWDLWSISSTALESLNLDLNNLSINSILSKLWPPTSEMQEKGRIKKLSSLLSNSGKKCLSLLKRSLKLIQKRTTTISMNVQCLATKKER